jgi:hypothetical protein
MTRVPPWAATIHRLIESTRAIRPASRTASNPSATLTSQRGNSYGFRSFATDADGSREVKAAAIDAGTHVTVNHGAAGRSLVNQVDLVLDIDNSSEKPRRRDAAQAWRRGTAFGHGVADSAAKRVEQVFLGMTVGRKVDPLAAAAPPAVVPERISQARTSRMDREAVRLQEQLDCVETVQDQMLRPASDNS